jgi:hypothetical protein
MLHRLRFQDDFSLAQSLPSLLDVADPTTQVAILESAEVIGDGQAKSQALGSLSARLTEPGRTEPLKRALTAAEGIGDILAVSSATNLADHAARSKNISSRIMKPVEIVTMLKIGCSSQLRWNRQLQSRRGDDVVPRLHR